MRLPSSVQRGMDEIRAEQRRCRSKKPTSLPNAFPPVADTTTDTIYTAASSTSFLSHIILSVFTHLEMDIHSSRNPALNITMCYILTYLVRLWYARKRFGRRSIPGRCPSNKSFSVVYRYDLVTVSSSLP